jgi:hypothetical protein
MDCNAKTTENIDRLEKPTIISHNERNRTNDNECSKDRKKSKIATE